MDQKDDTINQVVVGKLLIDSDGMVSFHYFRKGRWRRKCLFRIVEGELFIKDPGTRDIVRIGKVISTEGINLFIFY